MKDRANSAGRDPGPVVGLGASAGGLPALKAFLAEVPQTTPLAFVVIVHLSPNQPSILAELLASVSAIPVHTAADSVRVEAGNVYVVPPNRSITIQKRRLGIAERNDNERLPIDDFFQSLAKDLGLDAAAVVLSGSGSDGSAGLRHIHEHEGLVLAQTAESAEHASMPLSAVATGLVDFVLPPEKMPSRIADYFAVRDRGTSSRRGEPTRPADSVLHGVFAALRTRTGHDFSSYKLSTVLRRLNRRMNVNGTTTEQEYVSLLRSEPAEVDALFHELLIGVTSFFRDPESFEALSRRVLPDLISGVEDGTTLRVWIPGCSTGEEAYSVAMVMRELLDRNRRSLGLQIFATDIDPDAVTRARTGIFAPAISAQVGPERLRRFFVPEHEEYRVREDIRDSIVFSVQDIIKDPPFSRLHLLCCRNLLIYLNSDAQRRILPLFHHTLVPGGVLMLGSSETVGSFTRHFDVVDKKWRIFRRREVPVSYRQLVEFPIGHRNPASVESAPPREEPAGRVDFGRITRDLVVRDFTPTAILVAPSGTILHVHGRTGHYLEPPTGNPTNNIIDMAREGLRLELSAAIRIARSSGLPQVRHDVSVRSNGGYTSVTLRVIPQTEKAIEGDILVVIEPIESPVDQTPTADRGAPETEESAGTTGTRALERELRITRESQQDVVEQLEAANEELRSTNEEVQSANEELQSTNEELESSKEELQSLNEELQTLNSELQSKVEQLSAAHDDMRNLLNSTDIATIFVDNEVRVRRYTPDATKIVNLIHTDLGRPLHHVSSTVVRRNLSDDVQSVLDTLVPARAEVVTAEGMWFNMSIIPYRTIDNRIDGAVLTFASIGEQKETQTLLESQGSEASRITRIAARVFMSQSAPEVVLNPAGSVLLANNAFLELVARSTDSVIGANINDVHESLGRANIGDRARSLLSGQDEAEPVTLAFAPELSFSLESMPIATDGKIPDVVSLRFLRSSNGHR